jgi:hypothetical protein
MLDPILMQHAVVLTIAANVQITLAVSLPPPKFFTVVMNFEE